MIFYRFNFVYRGLFLQKVLEHLEFRLAEAVRQEVTPIKIHQPLANFATKANSPIKSGASLVCNVTLGSSVHILALQCVSFVCLVTMQIYLDPRHVLLAQIKHTQKVGLLSVSIVNLEKLEMEQVIAS